MSTKILKNSMMSGGTRVGNNREETGCLTPWWLMDERGGRNHNDIVVATCVLISEMKFHARSCSLNCTEEFSGSARS